MDRQFTWNGALFVVHPDTVGSQLDANMVLHLLGGVGEGARITQRRMNTGAFLATVELKSGDPGFAIPDKKAANEEIVAFHEVLMALPGDFRSAWLLAHTETMVMPVEPELRPDAPEDVKKSIGMSEFAELPI